jgi:hypothetical protein
MSLNDIKHQHPHRSTPCIRDRSTVICLTSRLLTAFSSKFKLRDSWRPAYHAVRKNVCESREFRSRRRIFERRSFGYNRAAARSLLH